VREVRQDHRNYKMVIGMAIKCIVCGTETLMTATKLCDRCYRITTLLDMLFHFGEKEHIEAIIKWFDERRATYEAKQKKAKD